MRILRRIGQSAAAAEDSSISPDLSNAADEFVFALARKLEAGRLSGFVVVCPSDGQLPPEFQAVSPTRMATIRHDRFTGAALALIELADFDDPLLSASVVCALEAAHGHREGAICGWMFSPCKGPQAILGLQHAMEYTLQGGSARYLLFPHRPLRALHMPTLLDPAQWSLLRTGVSDWAVLDWHGQLTWLPPAEEVGRAVSSLRFRGAACAGATSGCHQCGAGIGCQAGRTRWPADRATGRCAGRTVRP